MDAYVTEMHYAHAQEPVVYKTTPLMYYPEMNVSSSASSSSATSPLSHQTPPIGYNGGGGGTAGLYYSNPYCSTAPPYPHVGYQPSQPVQPAYFLQDNFGDYRPSQPPAFIPMEGSKTCDLPLWMKDTQHQYDQHSDAMVMARTHISSDGGQANVTGSMLGGNVAVNTLASSLLPQSNIHISQGRNESPGLTATMSLSLNQPLAMQPTSQQQQQQQLHVPLPLSNIPLNHAVSGLPAPSTNHARTGSTQLAGQQQQQHQQTGSRVPPPHNLGQQGTPTVATAAHHRGYTPTSSQYSPSADTPICTPRVTPLSTGGCGVEIADDMSEVSPGGIRVNK